MNPAQPLQVKSVTSSVRDITFCHGFGMFAGHKFSLTSLTEATMMLLWSSTLPRMGSLTLQCHLNVSTRHLMQCDGLQYVW